MMEYALGAKGGGRLGPPASFAAAKTPRHLVEDSSEKHRSVTIIVVILRASSENARLFTHDGGP